MWTNNINSCLISHQQRDFSVFMFSPANCFPFTNLNSFLHARESIKTSNQLNTDSLCEHSN
jgi:hypothetical protein